MAVKAIDFAAVRLTPIWRSTSIALASSSTLGLAEVLDGARDPLAAVGAFDWASAASARNNRPVSADAAVMIRRNFTGVLELASSGDRPRLTSANDVRHHSVLVHGAIDRRAARTNAESHDV